jgi:hypothetical protein
MEMSEEERDEILAPLSERDLSRRDELRTRYLAAIRIVMRLVVALYAESRELFPKDNPVYYISYSVEGLFRQLREARIEEGEDTLEKQFSAWPRLQALCRLVYYGSPHSDVPLRGYGGRLFRPPGENGDDDVLAGLKVFEHNAIRLSDATIFKVLKKLKIAEFKIGGQRRTGPVDFSDLRTEYIGVMYEGLLDYELREATEDDGAIIFLNIGNQPALPFSVIEDLSREEIANLVEELKDDAPGSRTPGESVSEADISDDEQGKENGGDDGKPSLDSITALEARIHKWSKRVVEETQVYMPHHNTVRAMDPTTREKYENEAATRVVSRIIRPGGTYLVNYEGNRRSTGTYYTRPELAVPAAHRILDPLVYETDGAGQKKVKRPADILGLKICDPAMGSGTFAVAALRYLTDSLLESFNKYVFPELGEGEPISQPLGARAKGYLDERLLKIQHDPNDEQWMDQVESQLKRSVVERCIYGVDINPLAVELGKLSLWIETLNPSLSFTFLDHKFRIGNSLVGAWIGSADSYPINAWNKNGVTESAHESLKEYRNSTLKQEKEIAEKNQTYDTEWFGGARSTIEDHLEDAREQFANLHSVASDTEREKLYIEDFRENEDIQKLRYLLDRWCSIWFWPTKELDSVLGPKQFQSPESDPQEITNRVRELSTQYQFFHWEVEFPDVFINGNSGFDAIVGNPPWELIRSLESRHLGRYYPDYYTWSPTQRSEKIENAIADRSQLGKDLISEIESTNSLNQLIRSPEWKRGGDSVVMSGKAAMDAAFTIRSWDLLADDGRMGLFLHDRLRGTRCYENIREYLIENHSVDVLVGFTNTDQWAFPIHRDRTFSLLVAGSEDTNGIYVGDYNTSAEILNQSDSFASGYVSWDEFEAIIGDSKSFPMIDDAKVVRLIGRLANNLQLSDVENDLFELGFDGDVSKLTREGKAWHIEENLPAPPDRSKPDDSFALIEGAAIGRFDESFNYWVEKFGRTAIWRRNPNGPAGGYGFRYVMNKSDAFEKGWTGRPAVRYMEVSGATNRYPLIAAYCSEGVGTQTTPGIDAISGKVSDEMIALSLLNSLVAGSSLRRFMTNQHVSFHVLRRLPWYQPSGERKQIMAQLAGELSLSTPALAPARLALESEIGEEITPVVDPVERLKKKIKLEVVTSAGYGLSFDEYKTLILQGGQPRLTFKRETLDEGGSGFVDEALDAYQQLIDSKLDKFVKRDLDLRKETLEAVRRQSEGIDSISPPDSSGLIAVVEDQLGGEKMDAFNDVLSGERSFKSMWD